MAIRVMVRPMGLYRARDLLLPPTLVSLARLPLALAFAALAPHPTAAFAILVAAAATDVLDGFIARRFDLATPAGAAVDPLTDKLFVLTVVVTLVRGNTLLLRDVLLLSAREIGELPLVVWLALSRRARRSRADYPRANILGKAATTLQFGTVAAALFHLPGLPWLVWATAIGGALAAAGYWARALRSR